MQTGTCLPCGLEARSCSLSISQADGARVVVVVVVVVVVGVVVVVRGVSSWIEI